MHPARPIDESHRLAGLRALGVPDTGPEECFDTLAGFAARLTGCPIAVLSLVDEQRRWFMKSAHGVPAGDTTLHDLSMHAAGLHPDDGLLEIPDLTLDPRIAAAAEKTDARPPPRLHASVLLKVDRLTVGQLCVIDVHPRALTPEQRKSLLCLGGMATELVRGRERRVLLDEERLRLLDFARSSGDWMWETDADLRYTWVSGTFEAITGQQPTSVYGQQIADSPLLDPLGQPFGEGRTFHALLQQRQHITRVITDKRTPLGTLQISRSAVPVFDARGRFIGYRGTARDVSAYIASERHTHGQAELLRKLSSQAPGVIFQFRLMPDRSMQYLYASDACRDMFGMAPPRDGAPHDGNESAEACRALHPGDRSGFVRSLFRAASKMAPWHREFRTLRDGRTVRWLEVRAMPEPGADRSVLWHGFVADVTARKETELALRSSEQRWNMAAEAAGIGIAQLDLAEGFLIFDAQACLNHGLPLQEARASVANWLGAIHPDDRDAIQSSLQQTVARRSVLEARYRLRRPDGQEAMLEIFAHCILDGHGQVSGVLGTCRDVTQQAMHEQLRRDKETAERASHAKSEFLSRVSHELRTPLNGILGFAQLMALDRVHPLAPDQARRLDSVLHAGHHLLELINEVLNLARIEQQDFALQQAPVDLQAAATTCLALIQPLADNAGVRLVAPEPSPHWSLADGRAVEQVLINLLSNAIKYNRHGGSVRVSLHRTEGRVQVSVSDEGDGLNPAQQAHLFEPFNRLGAEQRRVEGTGLGLVIARALALSMQGELLVRSAVGAGSTFTLSLSAGTAPAQAGTPGAPRVPALPPSPPQRLRTVLYIEDEPLNQMLLQEVFKARPQWQLWVAGDATSGLARLQDGLPDLLLIDMNLPDMNGLQLIRRVRADPATAALACVALSADAMQSQIDAALAAGYDAYWTKPIHVTRVLDDLSRWLADPSSKPQDRGPA
jgi:PAS domain S-box-containing protein